MRLNLHLLRVFHAVATAGSFSAAARALHISQPAVSKAIAELERQLDVLLVERVAGRAAGQSLTLSEAGSALNAHARAIFALEHAAIDDIQQRTGLKKGSLIVGASTTIANYWLPRYLRAYAASWPNIVLKVVVANTHDIVEDLIDCRLDLALVEGPVQADRVVYFPWREERLVLVAAPDFEAMPAPHEATDRLPAPPAKKIAWTHRGRLRQCTWLMREAGSGTREVAFDLLARNRIDARRYLEIGSNEAIARSVAAGLGIALLPYTLVEDLLQLGRLVELRLEGVEDFSRVLYRLERQDRPASPVVGAFLDILNRPMSSGIFEVGG